MARKYYINGHESLLVNQELTADRGEADPRACQSSKVRKTATRIPDYMNPKRQFFGYEKITVTEFKNGSRLKWPVTKEPPPPPENRERGSLSQSVKSRLNSAFNLGNAETSWLAMATLTYRVAPSDYETLKSHRSKFLDRMRKRFGEFDYAWILEFQKRGAAHFHIFIGDGGELGALIKSEPTRTKKRKGVETEILTGDVAEYVTEAWIEIVGDDSPKFLKFQRGGILEKMRSPDAAGRYAAKEAAKRCQKESSFPVSQWWGMSRKLKALARGETEISVDDFTELFPDSPMISKLWKKEFNKAG